MKKLTSNELRNLYLNFWKEKGHAIINPAPLISVDDNSVLFTTAGMQQLVPFFMRRNIQRVKC